MKAVIRDAEEKSRREKETEGSRGVGMTPTKSGLIRSRTVPPAVILHFVAKIASLEPHIEEVQAAEAVARMDRLAEMEMTRANNIIVHGDEINNRPRKEWFASQDEKISAKEAAKEKLKKIEERAGMGQHRLTRKKRRMRLAKEEMLQYQEEMRREQEEAEAQGAPKKKMILTTDAAIKSTARAYKKEAEKKVKESGERSLFDEDTAREKKQRLREKKRKSAVTSDSLGDMGLFDEEKVTFAKKSKTVSMDKLPKSSYAFTEFDPDMMKQKKNKGKGVKAFKSKKKHKRR